MEGFLAEGSPRSPLLPPKWMGIRLARWPEVRQSKRPCLGSPATVPHYSPTLPSSLQPYPSLEAQPRCALSILLFLIMKWFLGPAAKLTLAVPPGTSTDSTHFLGVLPPMTIQAPFPKSSPVTAGPRPAHGRQLGMASQE